MKVNAILVDKISYPALPNIYPRQNLYNFLDRKRGDRFTWISGLAGSGKSTLVASYLGRGDSPCLWYRLDENDNDLAGFFLYLKAAVERISPRKRRKLPLLTPEYLMDIPAFSRRFFRIIGQRLDPGSCLVFDNYHELPDNTPFHQVFIEGLMSLPNDKPVYIISRKGPPREFAGIIAANKLHLVGQDLLTLTLEETMGILLLENESRLSQTAMERIHRDTGGWMAGVILMARSTPTEEILLATGKSRIPEVVFEYLAGELFDSLDTEIKKFLLATAFLPRMTANLAQSLTGRIDADRILSEQIRSHLFIEELPTSDRTYRYHPLFREFLLAEGRKSLGNEAVASLRGRAAQILEDAGLTEDAVALYKESGDMERLSRLILMQASYLAQQGRFKILEKWLEYIPPDVLAANPWLSYWKGVCRLPFFPDSARTCFQTAFDKFNDRSELAGKLLAWSGAVDAIVFEWGYFTLFDPWIEWLDQRMGFETSFPSPDIEARVSIGMSIALICRNPRHPKLNDWITRALSASRACKNIDLYVQAGTYAIVQYAWSGAYAKAQVLNDEMGKQVGARKTSAHIDLTWRYLDATAHIWSQVPAEISVKKVTSALKIAKKKGIHTWDSMLLQQLLYISLVIGDLKRADAVRSDLKDMLPRLRYQDHIIFHHLSCLYKFVEGSLSQAEAHANAAHDISIQTGFLYPQILSRFTRAQILSAQGEPAEAEILLAEALSQARTVKSTIFEFMCLLGQAHIVLCQNSDEKADHLIRLALRLGRVNNYHNMIYWWQPRMLATICARAFKAGIELAYVKQLIRHLKLDPPENLGVMEAWPRPVKIRTLGTFQLSMRDAAGLPVKKAQDKPLLLLKAIITFGDRGAGREQIIDLLWPDTEADFANNSLKTTLHRLRQLVGSRGAVQLEGGILKLNPNYCWVDALAFERLCRQSEIAWTNVRTDTDRENALELTQTALAIYKGPFLEQGQDESWFIYYRERLKRKYVRAVMTAARYYKEMGFFDQAIALYEDGLEQDPLVEKFYQNIMRCYLSTGRQAEALSVFNRLSGVLSAANIRPSPRSIEIRDMLYTHSIGPNKRSNL